MSPAAAAEPESVVLHRVRAVVDAAGARGATLELEELVPLLPDWTPAEPAELSRWLAEHDPTRRVLRDRLAATSSGNADGASQADRARAAGYERAALGLLRGPLRPVRTTLLALAITGSTAYGRAAPGEDCDLFGVTRDDTLWLALLGTFLALRLRGTARDPEEPPIWCFNYMLEASTAEAEFRAGRGFLFAREALQARPVMGAEFYRSLLRRAPWMRAEAPRLYDRWDLGAAEPPRTEPGARSRALRWLNLLAFPIVASYLQLAGLRRNHALRRTGRAGEAFRTVTERRRFALRSEKYDRLGALYAGASVGPEPTA